MRKKGRGYAARCNDAVRKPYGKNVYIALELAQKAYEAHALPYQPGLSEMERFPPDRFTWICDPGGDAKNCVKLRDNQTGRLVAWPHWSG
jgi:hypothetical protein